MVLPHKIDVLNESMYVQILRKVPGHLVNALQLFSIIIITINIGNH